jgi:hypothetical protein
VTAADLRVAPGCDCFVMGAYAAMELGPDALNLAGAQAGARRIYSHLASSGPHKHVDGAGASASRMLGGDGNMFAALEDEDQ